MNKSANILFSAILIVAITRVNSVIIPDELPSILSVIYSNIPTLKKGTDSRLGWGFRFGDRADFQVLVELGPQTNTQPLANQQDNKNSKRNVANNAINTIYAQQNQKYKVKDQISDTEGGKWIENWSKNVGKKEPEVINYDLAKPGIGIGEIDAKSVIPEEDTQLSKFEGLFQGKSKKLTSTTTTTTTLKPKTTTSFKDALDNVNLDDE